MYLNNDVNNYIGTTSRFLRITGIALLVANTGVQYANACKGFHSYEDETKNGHVLNIDVCGYGGDKFDIKVFFNKDWQMTKCIRNKDVQTNRLLEMLLGRYSVKLSDCEIGDLSSTQSISDYKLAKSAEKDRRAKEWMVKKGIGKQIVNRCRQYGVRLNFDEIPPYHIKTFVRKYSHLKANQLPSVLTKENCKKFYRKPRDNLQRKQ